MTKVLVERELLERVLYLMDNYIGTTHPEEDEIRAILSDPSPAGVDGLEVVAWMVDEDGSAEHQPLCRISVAQAIIDKQAARIAELQLDADRYRWLEANSTYGIDYRQRPELTLPIYAPDHREGLDAAIDAAMERSKGE